MVSFRCILPATPPTNIMNSRRRIYSPHPTAAPPTGVTNSRRFMSTPKGPRDCIVAGRSKHFDRGEIISSVRHVRKTPMMEVITRLVRA
jgi:hypothetical protein